LLDFHSQFDELGVHRQHHGHVCDCETLNGIVPHEGLLLSQQFFLAIFSTGANQLHDKQSKKQDCQTNTHDKYWDSHVFEDASRFEAR